MATNSGPSCLADCRDGGTIGDASPTQLIVQHSVDTPPRYSSSSTSGLYRALLELQNELDPVVKNVTDCQTKTLLEALEAENKALRVRIRELEAISSSIPPPPACTAPAAPPTPPICTPPAASPPPEVRIPELSAEPTPAANPTPERVGPIAVDVVEDTKTEDRVRVIEPKANFGRSRSSFVRRQLEAPHRAFVINVRRFIEAQESFDLLHQLINSTAMAALTLCSAGSGPQLRTTCCFILFTVVIFVLHGHMWDTLEVEDLKILLPVISDDEDQGQQTPNRLLKVLTFTRSPFSSIGRHILELFFTFVVVWGWLLVDGVWETGYCRELSWDDKTWVDATCVFFVGNSETDAEVLGMQVGVGTLMLVLHLLFDGLHYNETCAVMPPDQTGGVLDPREHVPWRFWLGGLPSMWFTSEETLQAFKTWMKHANRARRVVNISSQEIAIYALSGQDERKKCEETLKHARQFDAAEYRFIGDEKLDIDLCFFDSKLQIKDKKYAGSFLRLMDEDS